LATSNHLDFPVFDSEEFLKSISTLVNVEKEWFPKFDDGTNGQFYTRFLHISTDPVMGVKTANNSKIVVVLNPTTLRHRGLSVKCSDNKFNKNWPLGHAQYSLGGNLGPLVPAVSDAK
jgi:branched-subunit amino acid aminotransferase/4-amino-4-deoxychorismate lyase